MARIRTIKPEFWDSPDTARASHRARLFFIALWNWADDYGVGTANGKALVGFAFPNDDDITAKDFPSLRKEVADAFGVVFYEVDGRPYYAIPSWDKHQRTERKAKRQNPPPPEGVSPVQSSNHGSTVDTQGTSDAMQGGSGVGTGEQGNRGTGEEVLMSIASRSTNEYPADFEEFWSHYPIKQGKAAALKAWRQAKRKAGPAAIIAGAQRYANDPNRSSSYTKYAQGWLNDGRWDDEPLPARDDRPRTRDENVLAWADLATSVDDRKAIGQ